MTTTTIDSFVDVSAWLTHIGTYYTIHIQSGWEFVDALRLGIEQFGGQNRGAVSELYDLASQHVGLAVRTLQNYVSISRTFPPERRQPELGINHYIALQGLPDGQQDEFAEMAVANGLSVEALRHEVRKTRPGYITDDSNQPGRTMSPPSAYRAPATYDATEIDDVPFSHADQPDDSATYDSLWTDERISSMVQAASCDVEYTDADGMNDYRQYVLAGDVCRLLRTMRDEYEIMLSRR